MLKDEPIIWFATQKQNRMIPAPVNAPANAPANASVNASVNAPVNAPVKLNKTQIEIVKAGHLLLTT